LAILVVNIVTCFVGNNTNLITNGTFSFIQDALDPKGESHERGNTTAYDKLVRRVYIIGHVWGFSKNFSLPQGGVLTATAKVRCLRANQEGGGGGKNAGGDSQSDNSGAPLLIGATGTALLLSLLTGMFSAF